jgi:APA family basic amino acid/polyamine antiporter
MVQCDKTNRRKTLDEFALEAEGNEEEASLSLFDLLCIGIGGTVGSGVFVLTVCLLSAFSYMELSAAIPTRGSTYAFSLHALGEYQCRNQFHDVA